MTQDTPKKETQRTTVDLPKKLHKKIKDYCSKHNMKMKEFIVNATDYWYNEVK